MNSVREIIFNFLDSVILVILAYRIFGFIIRNRKRGISENDEGYYVFTKTLVKPTIALAVIEQWMFYYGYEEKASMMILTSLAAILIMFSAAHLEKIMREENKKTRKRDG